MEFLLSLSLILLAFPVLSQAQNSRKIVIAHRGASGYVPEHTLESKTMAFAMGADYLEQDLVMTKDGEVVVMHDYYLDGITDVRDKFPGRAQADGKYYVFDFTLEEVRSLRMSEPFTYLANGTRVPIWPGRFPLLKSRFEIHTFQEELELIQGMMKSTGRLVGIYPEIKNPWLFKQQGMNISIRVLEILKEYGYTSKASLCFLQCFDPNELKNIHDVLLPSLGMNLKLVQLMAETSWLETYEQLPNGTWVPYNYDWMFGRNGMKIISSWADGVGPWKPFIVPEPGVLGKPTFTPLVRRAHRAGMLVHPYTFRRDTGQLPNYAYNFNDLLRIFYFEAGVDGLFTDQTDLAVKFLGRRW